MNQISPKPPTTCAARSLALTAWLILMASALAACDGGGTGGAGGDGGGGGEGGGGSGKMVEFSFAPGWSGVTSVGVIGSFDGGSWDPTAPFVALKDDGTGAWKGSVSLPDGQYQYLFAVTGDSAEAADTVRYAVDPLRSAVQPCAAEAPTYSDTKVRPCSMLTVPAAVSDPVRHLMGSVTMGGGPASGWLVELQREEDGQDHVLANRVSSGADGAFDLVLAPGSYRVYILHPNYYSQDDTERDPLAEKSLRRAFSSVIPVTENTTIGPCEVEYTDYDKLMPVGSASLPVQLSYVLSPGAKDGRVAVYGTKGGTGTRIFDPWFASDYGSLTTIDFNGTFNTTQADEAQVVLGEQYHWGIWQRRDAGEGGLWNGQSMVFPIVFQ